MSRPRQFAIVASAALIAVHICVYTKLVPAFGKWYSRSDVYRRQTDALLSGRVTLSSSPTEMSYDKAWGDNGVQQVWGLGVPVWRMPFEIAARVVGRRTFPDRLALGVAIGLAAYVVIRVFGVSYVPR